jgi:DNA-binding transcriptional regulator PaaX
MLWRLDYNQLKRVVLRALADKGPMDSDSLTQTLGSASVEFEIHAVRMALMRYYRQGLLRRVRSGGLFRYTLTERGIVRLEWLEKQTGRVDSRKSPTDTFSRD